jgi:hypothetical protein
MKITLWCDEELESIDVDIKDVQTYIDLIDEHGYQDMDGNEYTYAYSRMDAGFEMYIYLIDSVESRMR